MFHFISLEMPYARGQSAGFKHCAADIDIKYSTDIDVETDERCNVAVLSSNVAALTCSHGPQNEKQEVPRRTCAANPGGVTCKAHVLPVSKANQIHENAVKLVEQPTT